MRINETCGCPSMSMHIHCFACISMDMHAWRLIWMHYPWICVHIGISMDVHSCPWICIHINGYARMSMPFDIHGNRCMFMYIHAYPCVSIDIQTHLWIFMRDVNSKIIMSSTCLRSAKLPNLYLYVIYIYYIYMGTRVSPCFLKDFSNRI